MCLKSFKSTCSCFFKILFTTFKTNKMPDISLLLSELSALNYKCCENNNDFSNFRIYLILNASHASSKIARKWPLKQYSVYFFLLNRKQKLHTESPGPGLDFTAFIMALIMRKNNGLPKWHNENKIWCKYSWSEMFQLNYMFKLYVSVHI